MLQDLLFSVPLNFLLRLVYWCIAYNSMIYIEICLPDKCQIIAQVSLLLPLVSCFLFYNLLVDVLFAFLRVLIKSYLSFLPHIILEMGLISKAVLRQILVFNYLIG